MAEIPGILSKAVSQEVTADYDECRLCWAVSGSGQRFPENEILLSSGEYVVVPALGGFVPGYVMLVSRNHRGSLGTLGHDEVSDIERRLCETLSLLTRRLGMSEWVLFEHGTTLRYGVKTCCVDHLHIHLLPASNGLLDAATRQLSRQPIRLTSPRDVKDSLQGAACNYLLIRETHGPFALFTEVTVPPQYLRRLLAKQVGIPELWNWRTNPYVDNSIGTARLFREAGISGRKLFFAHGIEGRTTERVRQDVEDLKFEIAQACPHVVVKSMFDVLSPEVLEKLEAFAEDPDRALVETEVEYLRSCDVVVADLSLDGHVYVGALMEIVYACNAGIPVVAVVKRSHIGKRRWLRGHVTHIVEDYRAAAHKIAEMLLPVQGRCIEQEHEHH